jgi:hypothetical protein
VLQLDPSALTRPSRYLLLENDRAADNQLDVLNRCDLAPYTNSDMNSVRPRTGLANDRPRWLPVHLQQQQRPRRDEASSLSYALEPGGENRFLRQIDIRLAITQLTAGRVVTCPDARKAIADIEDAVPVVKRDTPVITKLKELDGIDVLLDEV